MKKLALFLHLAFLIIAPSCRTLPPEDVNQIPETGTPTRLIPTSTQTRIIPTATGTSEIVVTDTPAPTPTADVPRTLVICTGAQPASMYLYGGSMYIQQVVLKAIYDGPIDEVRYTLQPVILDKIPSLDDGDAWIESVLVAEGDLVVNAAGDPVTLSAGERIRPAGCRSQDCAQTYAGGEIEVDQLRTRFRLKENLLWSDGSPLTARDSVYSFELANETASIEPHFFIPNEKLLHLTAAYTAPDTQSTLWTGLPGFLDPHYQENFWLPLPEHELGQFTAAELLAMNDPSDAAQKPLGWGPFVMDEWVVSSHISMHRNPNYFRASEGLPKFEHLLFRFVGQNTSANIAKILAGECDIVTLDAYIEGQFDLAAELDREGLLELVAVPVSVFEHLDFGIRPWCFDEGGWSGCLNAGRPDFFGDRRVRQAFAFCLDRREVARELFDGRALVPDTYTHPLHPLANPDAAVYPFDPAPGRALLEEAGWMTGEDGVRVYTGSDPNIPPGTRLSVRYSTTTASDRQRAAVILSESLAGCGIETRVEFIEPGDFFADGPDGPLFGRRFDLGLFAWLTGRIPPCEIWLSDQIPGSLAENGAEDWSLRNTPGYSRPAYDAACRAALAALPGEPAFAENHLLAQAIFAEDLPSVPLYTRISVSAARPDFCGPIMETGDLYETLKIEELDYGPGCP